MQDLARKLVFVSAIENAAKQAENDPHGLPNSALNFVGGLLVAGVSIAICCHLFDPTWAPIAATIFGSFAVLAFNICGPFTKTFAEQLDELVTAYEPVDDKAYSELREASIQASALKPAAVMLWALAERKALHSLGAFEQGIDT